MNNKSRSSGLRLKPYPTFLGHWVQTAQCGVNKSLYLLASLNEKEIMAHKWFITRRRYGITSVHHEVDQTTNSSLTDSCPLVVPLPTLNYPFGNLELVNTCIGSSYKHGTHTAYTTRHTGHIKVGTHLMYFIVA